MLVDYQDIVNFVNFLCSKEYRLLGQPFVVFTESFIGRVTRIHPFKGRYQSSFFII